MNPRKMSDEMVIAILDKRVALETENEAEMIDFIREVMLGQEINLTQLGMLMSAVRQKFADKAESTSVEKQREILEAMRGQTIEATQIILNEALEIAVKRRSKIRVQRDGSVRAELTFTKEEWAEVMLAKEVVSHSVPSGDEAKVLAYCARFTNSKKDSRASSSHPDGTVCGSRYQLQVDHIVSRWLGGSNSVENLQLLCGVHNRYKYELEIAKTGA